MKKELRKEKWLKKWDRQYESLDEIQETFMERNKKPDDIDRWGLYYDANNVCVIHCKFGRLRKWYVNLSTEFGLSQEFIDLYKKYWYADKENEERLLIEVVNLVEKNREPIIFYKNYSDEETTFTELKEYFNYEKDKKLF